MSMPNFDSKVLYSQKMRVRATHVAKKEKVAVRGLKSILEGIVLMTCFRVVKCDFFIKWKRVPHPAPGTRGQSMPPPFPREQKGNKQEEGDRERTKRAHTMNITQLVLRGARSTANTKKRLDIAKAQG